MRWQNVDIEKMQFGVVEQMPFKVPAGTKEITEMAPTKSNDRILPITEITLPYFMRQFELQERQKTFARAGGGEYHDNDLVIAKPDGSPQRRDRMSTNFGQLIRHLEMPHIRYKIAVTTCAGARQADCRTGRNSVRAFFRGHAAHDNFRRTHMGLSRWR